MKVDCEEVPPPTSKPFAVSQRAKYTDISVDDRFIMLRARLSRELQVMHGRADDGRPLAP